MGSSSVVASHAFQKASLSTTKNACGRRSKRMRTLVVTGSSSTTTASSLSTSLPSSALSSSKPSLFSNVPPMTAVNNSNNNSYNRHSCPQKDDTFTCGQSPFFSNNHLFTIHETDLPMRSSSSKTRTTTTTVTPSQPKLSIRPRTCTSTTQPGTTLPTTFTWSDLYQEIDNVLSSSSSEIDNDTNPTYSEKDMLSSFPTIEWSFDNNNNEEEEVDISLSTLPSLSISSSTRTKIPSYAESSFVSSVDKMPRQSLENSNCRLHHIHHYHHHGLVRCRNFPSHLNCLARY